MTVTTKHARDELSKMRGALVNAAKALDTAVITEARLRGELDTIDKQAYTQETESRLRAFLIGLATGVLVTGSLGLALLGVL